MKIIPGVTKLVAVGSEEDNYLMMYFNLGDVYAVSSSINTGGYCILDNDGYPWFFHHKDIEVCFKPYYPFNITNLLKEIK
jgi:hypothetical protein